MKSFEKVYTYLDEERRPSSWIHHNLHKKPCCLWVVVVGNFQPRRKCSCGIDPHLERWPDPWHNLTVIKKNIFSVSLKKLWTNLLLQQFWFNSLVVPNSAEYGPIALLAPLCIRIKKLKFSSPILKNIYLTSYNDIL